MIKDVHILEDILQSKITNQILYNKGLIDIRNPEVRQIFTELRDDELRDIIALQQKIEKQKAKPAIISKIFPSKTKL